MERLSEAMGQAVSDAFKILLSEKHLYQSITVDLTPVKMAENAAIEALESEVPSPMRRGLSVNPKAFVEEQKAKVLSGLWFAQQITPTTLNLAADSIFIHFELPVINTFCNQCKERWPFQPVSGGSYVIQGNGEDEFFYLGYKCCQPCKSEPIRFLVRREKLKLQLAGRYPMEVLPTPKVLPKSASKYYGDAMIAHHAGQTLAGLFLLRVFIEQFWRKVPEVQKLVAENSRATGDEQGKAYQATLPPALNSEFPSLKDVYGKLSEAIHSASADASLFDGSCAQIEEHFDARRLFKIPS